MSDDKLVIFEDKKIRRTLFNEEWWYCANDIIIALTDSTDPNGYLKDMRRRDEGFAQGWGQIATPLLIDTIGGKQQLNCVSAKGAFRLIQSVPSKKAEPFKQWLAQLGHERLQEIENPELAQNRAKGYYEIKGYPKEWIDKRLRGIAIRQELTDEWKNRGANQETDFAILTNEISKATFGKTVQEYKEFKEVPKKNQNLRDHMNDLELIFTMLGEKATTEITKTRDAKQMPQLKSSAKRGGEIAGNAKKELETETKKSVTTKQNYLHLAEKKKLTQEKK